MNSNKQASKLFCYIITELEAAPHNLRICFQSVQDCEDGRALPGLYRSFEDTVPKKGMRRNKGP